ncbi:uncharacterized protein RJT21DRAFT_119079 [Scheffersomyces amazonensis]|uniref:uncharacterized protein n=1 Tax=Scheffersomyces amazonensis TaxID=1078765 RepID=UPI00315DA42C
MIQLEVTIFLHTASPVIIGLRYAKRHFSSAKGTELVIRSIKEFAPQIERFVFTSSIVATPTVAEVTNPSSVGGESIGNRLRNESTKLLQTLWI